MCTFMVCIKKVGAVKSVRCTYDDDLVLDLCCNMLLVENIYVCDFLIMKTYSHPQRTQFPSRRFSRHTWDFLPVLSKLRQLCLIETGRRSCLLMLPLSCLVLASTTGREGGERGSREREKEEKDERQQKKMRDRKIRLLFLTKDGHSLVARTSKLHLVLLNGFF